MTDIQVADIRVPDSPSHKLGMPARIYCDHNFLITLRDETLGYHSQIQQALSSGAVEFVLSPWTWVEIARAHNIDALSAVAELLRPKWLPERRRLQQDEVEQEFFKYANTPYQRKPPLRSLIEVAANLTRMPIPLDKNYTILEFAKAIKANLMPIETAEQNNVAARIVNLKNRSRLTPATEIQILKKNVNRLVPSMTPAGIALGEEIQEGFLQQIHVNHFPSLAVETALMEDGMRVGASLQAQTFADLQHATVALPYVDLVLTDDRKLAAVIGRVKPLLSFPTASVINRAMFDHRFLSAES